MEMDRFRPLDQLTNIDIVNEVRTAPRSIPAILAPLISIPVISENLPIPKVFHRVYGLWTQESGSNARLPDKYASILQSWHVLYPDWEHKLWGKLDAYNFVRYNYPNFYPIFLNYPKQVQRAAALRYLLIFHFGGFYLDMDILPKDHIQTLLNKYSTSHMLMFEETRLTAQQAEGIGRQHSIRLGKPEDQLRIANYMFASTPRHPFLLEVLVELKARASLQVYEDYDVLYSTGPDVLSTLIARMLTRRLTASESSVTSAEVQEMFGACVVPASVGVYNYVDDVRVVFRPEDQMYFDHLVHGSWRQH